MSLQNIFQEVSTTQNLINFFIDDQAKSMTKDHIDASLAADEYIKSGFNHKLSNFAKRFHSEKQTVDPNVNHTKLD